MKDPLQPIKLPHEVLGVAPDADSPTISRKFMEAMRRDPVRAKNARDDLLDPLRRSWWYDLFQYHQSACQQLKPSPSSDPTVLETARREETAGAWQRHLRKTFPDLDTTHSLAVLYYWWAEYGESRLAADFREAEENGHLNNGALNGLKRQIDGLKTLWEHAIGYWSVLINDAEFWKGFKSLSEEQQGELRNRLVLDLTRKLENLHEFYVKKALPDWAQEYQGLAFVLNTEMSVGREVREANLLKRRGVKCTAGRLVLEWLGYLDQIRDDIEQRYKKKPSPALGKLRDALSRYRWIGQLIDQNKAAEALDAIKKLPEEERHSNEVAHLRSRACHQVGNHEASLGETEKALTSWRSALRYWHTKEEGKQIRKDVAEACLAAANKRRDQQPDEAMKILEGGLALVHEDGEDRVPEAANLRVALADLLVKRAVKAVNEVQKTFALTMQAIQKSRQPDWGQAWSRLEDVKAVFDTAIADLDRAAELGSKEAEQLAKKVRDERQAIEGSLYFQRGVDTINRAMEGTKRDNKGFTKERKAAVRRGLTDFEKAEELGVPQAAQQAKVARDILQQADTGLLDIPEGAQELLQQAHEAAGAGNWDDAIRHLKRVRRSAPRSARPFIQKNLATCYANRAIQKSNKAIEIHRPAAEKQQEYARNYNGHLSPWYLRLINIVQFPMSFRGQFKCGDCGGIATSGAHWNGKDICHRCVGRLEKLGKASPRWRVVALINSAVSDVRSALALDPDNADIRSQRDQVESLWRDVCDKQGLVAFVIKDVCLTILAFIMYGWPIWLPILGAILNKSGQ